MKVKIGSLVYNLRLSQMPLYGCADIKELEILVNNKFPKPVNEQTFLHEAVHLMLDEIGQEELCEDESFVEAFSKQIHFFLKNNNLNKIYEFIGGANGN